MGLGNTVKAIWTLLQGTTNPDVVALYNNLYLRLEGARMNARQGMGNVYFVSGFHGSDAAGVNGRSPLTPFATIAHALTQCVNNRNDYIFCYDLWHQEDVPINVSVNAVHIIGVAGPSGYAGFAPQTAGATFNFADGEGDNAEIAGFAFGGANAIGNACIELQGDNNDVWIHDCTFGHLWCGDPPVVVQDGIHIMGPAVCHGGLIENCWFHGNAVGAGDITRCGVMAEWWSVGTVRNNYFLKCPGIDVGGERGGGVYLASCNQVSVIHNKIGIADDAGTGNGIYLDNGCEGCLVASNEANQGLDNAANNPFVDIHGATVPNANDWMCNQRGKDMIDPATA